MRNKRIIISAILIFIIFSLFLSFASAYVWVNGYTRENGTYVQGYWRTSPDGDPTNNIGYPGNFNPNTGKVTPGNPETYLKNYYKYSKDNMRKIGFSSVDYAAIATTINNIGKVNNAPPITIGSSIEDVIMAMGLPDSVQISSSAYKYRKDYRTAFKSCRNGTGIDPGNPDRYGHDRPGG